MDSERSLPDVSTKILEKSGREGELKSPRLVLASESVAFIKRGARYVPAKQCKLKNSLLAGVGFLELANAGDFAANVWNQLPVPRYVVALMAVGGTLALSLSYFAFKDSKLSWRNLHLLRKERHDLQRQKTQHGPVKDEQIVRDLDTRLDVSFREIGTELIGRIGMDIFMGSGAVVIGIGTFMAIGGANPRVWHASNLLSGYVGNVPLALYALINAAWAVYVWMKAHQHGVAGAKVLHGEVPAALLKRRVRTVQMYAAINGVTSILGGAGSLISATMWWGYMILIVVIISSASCNYIWRRKIAYERPFGRDPIGMTQESLVRELEFVVSVQQILKETPSKPLHRHVLDPLSITSVVEFILYNDLFEDFCVRLVQDTQLATALFGIPEKDLTIDSQSLSMVDKVYAPRILEIADICIRETGPMLFQYRKRYLLETLGCYMCLSQAGTSKTTLDTCSKV
ncbi:hypothetical protein K432DRAFT_310668 [Lepidopterella palustris CBS 459.81]|uniref:Integral membrane protein n=1 Tax=Lepidopterella palustris CBS 459.81 TaxID=1314670 RepID=A0A8E2DZ77_9PEZI|nr:hypothetical protein K432DRAFT_310668 [Lepidopterella palustris CBS 459.81]